MPNDDLIKPGDTTCKMTGDAVVTESNTAPGKTSTYVRAGNGSSLIVTTRDSNGVPMVIATAKDGTNIKRGVVSKSASTNILPDFIVDAVMDIPADTKKAVDIVSAAMKDSGISCADGKGNNVTPVILQADVKKMDQNRGKPIVIGG